MVLNKGSHHPMWAKAGEATAVRIKSQNSTAENENATPAGRQAPGKSSEAYTIEGDSTPTE
jgi:hypothetical protein